VVAAQHLNLLDLVTAGDWLLQLRLTHRQGLANYASCHRGRGAAGSTWSSEGSGF
jgi:hypothetical protein